MWMEDLTNMDGIGSVSHVLVDADFTRLTMSWLDNSLN